jgi:hypothetical protein
MEQIVYISTARAQAPDAAQLEEVLRVSRRNNHRDGLTGLLVVGGRRFLQVLEGPSKSLDLTYRRIRADQRHFALVELGRKPITRRSFPDWDMAYQEGASADAFDDLVAIVTRITETIEDPSLKAQLRGFAEVHTEAA